MSNDGPGSSKELRPYPPRPADVFDAFHRWLEGERGLRYVILSEPDTVERERPEIDYVLAAETAVGRQVAAEASSIWRSARAGKEDRDWGSWTSQVAEWARDRLQGRYIVVTDLRIPGGFDARAFADELVALVAQEDSELTELNRSGRNKMYRINDMDVRISKRGPGDGAVSFARQLQSEDLAEFDTSIRAILDKKSPKLRLHKEQGRETWLVIYNTMWTVRPASDLTPLVRSWLGPEQSHIDYIAFVEGNPPDDAWIITIERVSKDRPEA